MNISHFDDLLRMARQQQEPQRLLLVFAVAAMPLEGTQEQHAKFLAGHGGALVPSMCVDKSSDEVVDFASLKAESDQFLADWHTLFVSTLSGDAMSQPADSVIEAALAQMVESIKLGALANILAFDRQGVAFHLVPQATP